jgi:hypothetical protein
MSIVAPWRSLAALCVWCRRVACSCFPPRLWLRTAGSCILTERMLLTYPHTWQLCTLHWCCCFPHSKFKHGDCGFQQNLLQYVWGAGVWPVHVPYQGAGPGPAAGAAAAHGRRIRGRCTMRGGKGVTRLLQWALRVLQWAYLALGLQACSH